MYQDKQLFLEELKFIKIKIMSIGNLKNSGNQGNNFPWQLKMLEGLQAIYNEVKKPLTCVEDGVTICGPTDGLNVNLHDGSGNPITSTPDGLGNTGIDVNIINALPLEVNITEANDSILIYGFDGVANQPVSVTPTGEVNIRPLDCDDKVSLCFNDGVSDVTVSSTNPLPVNAVVTVTVPTPLPVSQDPTSNPWVVGQATHDNLNANANIQVDNTDVSAANPVPVLQQYPDTPYASAIVATGISTTPIIFSAGTTSISVQNLGNDNIRIDTDASSGIILPPGVSITWDAPVGQRFDTFTFTGLSVSSLFIVTAVIAS